MKEVLKVVGFGALALFLLYLVSAATGLFGLSFNRFAAPYQEETRRITFEESATFNQGMAVDLDNLCRQMRSATDEQTKAGLADTIRLRASRYDLERLPSQTRRCVEEIR